MDNTTCGGCGEPVDATQPRCDRCGYPDGSAMIERGWTRETAHVVTLTVRHPDYENAEYRDIIGPVRFEDFELDLGSMFNGPADFDPSKPDHRQWAADHLASVAHLPETSAVRAGMHDEIRFLLDRIAG